MKPVLSLADLERFDPQAPDPQAPRRGREQRFFCPVCPDAGDGSDRRAWNRCLSLNLDTGAWKCHRCGAEGLLRDYWTPLPRRERQRLALKRTFALPNPAPAPEKAETLRAMLQKARPRSLAGTPGEAYLEDRGIPVDLAHRNGVRWTPNWGGRPAVLFPLRGEAGELLAVTGRYTDDRKPKTRTFGPAGEAVFVTGGAWEQDLVVLVEGPFDALSLALAGRPALALAGTHLPAWVVRRCAFRRVLVALDADETGDRRSEELADRLRSLGAKPERLRPTAKDWNDLLRAEGLAALQAAIGLTPRWAVQPGDVIELPDGRQKFVTDRQGDLLLLEDGQTVHLADVRRAWRPEPAPDCPACRAWRQSVGEAPEPLQDARRGAAEASVSSAFDRAVRRSTELTPRSELTEASRRGPNRLTNGLRPSSRPGKRSLWGQRWPWRSCWTRLEKGSKKYD